MPAGFTSTCHEAKPKAFLRVRYTLARLCAAFLLSLASAWGIRTTARPMNRMNECIQFVFISRWHSVNGCINLADRFGSTRLERNDR